MTRPNAAIRALLAPGVLRQIASTTTEIIAIAIFAVLVAALVAPIWALLPVAVYLLVVSIALGRPRPRR